MILVWFWFRSSLDELAAPLKRTSETTTLVPRLVARGVAASILSTDFLSTILVARLLFSARIANDALIRRP
jgi:hypothetical protein